ncbi:MAG: 7TM domain-containing protein [Planctomycetota bacterium]
MASDHPQVAPDELRDGRWQLIRRKKNIGPVALTAISVAGVLPLVLVFARILAMPWGESLQLNAFETLRSLGVYLNRSFTLDWIPPSDRSTALYLLLLPTGAMLVTLARLTLGIRVLGLRAILLAIGFQAVGVLSSLALMLVVVGTIVLIRPWFRRIRLPMYARIPVILCLVAMIMVGALLVAPRLGSEAIWNVAFFPVIIMAMLAESVAKTLEKDDLVLAVWRATWTIVLALAVLLLGDATTRLTFQFPELTLTQLVSIVLIAEFVDLRLLEEWPARISRYFAGARPWYTAKPKVAVVRNRDYAGVLAKLGRPAPEIYRSLSIQRQIDALRDGGFEVKVFEGDRKLLFELARFLPQNPRPGVPGGMVLNLATGIQGVGRFAHVPAMLEMAGIPYTGPDPLGHANLTDRFALMNLLERAQVPVPRHYLVEDPTASAAIEFPAAARPRYEPDAERVVVRHRRSLLAAVRAIRHSYGQPAVVEEIVGGRKIHVAMLGNDSVECLPLVEAPVGEGDKLCPAPLSEDVAERVRACARAAYRAAGCRDYARVDVQFLAFDDPVVVDIRWVDLFAPRGAFLTAAQAGGYTLATLLRRIVVEASKRYRVGTSPGRVAQSVAAPDEPQSVQG